MASINMVSQQIVRDRAVPLPQSLSAGQSLYADLLKAKSEREKGIVGRSSEELLTDVDRVIAKAEQQG